MFNRFRKIPVHPALAQAKAVLSPSSTAMSASMAASSAIKQTAAHSSPNHIPVPGFGRKPYAAAPAAAPVTEPAVVAEPVVEPAIIAAPVVELAPVAPVVAPPTWPNANVVRSYATCGHARLRFTIVATGKSKDFIIRGIRRQEIGVVDYYVYVQRNVQVAYGSNEAYLGCILARDMNFRPNKEPEEEYIKHGAFFKSWWDAITQGRHLSCVTVSCRESRSDEAKAVRAAKNAAEAEAKWNASIAKVAANAGQPPTVQATAAIHTALKILKGMDADRATLRNAEGFSASASYHGHTLANLPTLTVEQALVGRDLVKKYRKQLSGSLVAQALDEVEVD